jgi:pimeloyl-ACP methyl ester carboxylesterase
VPTRSSAGLRVVSSLFLAAMWITLAAAAVAGQAPPPAPPAADPNRLPSEGLWQGTVKAPQGDLFVRIDVRRDPAAATDAPPEVLIIAPRAGALGLRGEGVRAKGRELGFTLASRGAKGRFSGAVDEDGSAFAGTLTLSGAGTEQEVPFSLARTANAKLVEGHTVWDATLQIQGTALPMSLVFAEAGPLGTLGAIDIPIQGLEGFPLLVERGEGGTLTATIPVMSPAVIELAPQGEDTLAGTFRQAGMTAPITFRKAVGASTVAMRRPQTPQPPFPYVSRDVIIPHRFGHQLAGTLVVPNQAPAADGSPPAKLPAVVLVSGSGPQDRDESLFGHRPFLVLADALARQGIAVLRYDDRGIGASTGSFAGATTFDFATDADEASEWLKRQPGIDPARVGIVGHSEGGLIAPIVATWQWRESPPQNPVRFVVLLAGPGVDGASVLRRQMRQILETQKLPAETVDAICVAQSELIDAAIARAPEEMMLAKAIALTKAQAAVAAALGQPADEASVAAGAKEALAQISGRWMLEFLALDPAPWIAATRVPILAMNGSLDTQVDAEINLPAIAAAAKAGGVPVTVRTLAGLNHLFQPATTGSPDEYPTIETTFDPAAMQEIAAWILEASAAPLPAPLAATPDQAPATGQGPLRVRPGPATPPTTSPTSPSPSAPAASPSP